MNDQESQKIKEFPGRISFQGKIFAPIVYF